MRKITIFALHLGYGGIERCISMISNSLREQYQIEIISTYKLLNTPAFPFNRNIEIKYLIEEKPNRQEFFNALKKLNFIQVWKELKKAKHILKLKKERMVEAIKTCESDILISTRDIHNTWLGRYGKKECIKIGWEHNHHHNNKKYIKKLVKSVENLDYMVLVSQELKEFYEKRVSCKCVYIPNAIEKMPDHKSTVTEHNLISVGRLAKEKGYIDLISVFHLIHKLYPDWILHLVGDGSEREKLEAKIKQLHLENVIVLHGFQTATALEELYQKSSIYLMSSYTESFGLVLLEAFSHGLPCVAFDSAEGARTLISNNWDGYLIQNRNYEQMAKKIGELIQNQNRRIVMGDNGYKKATQYQIDQIKEKWISLFEKGKV